MRGRSRRRDGGAENNSKGKGNFCVGEHCRISSRQLCGYTQEKTVNLVSYSRPFVVATPHGNFRQGHEEEGGLKPALISVASVDEEHLIITEAPTARGSRIV